MLKKIVAPFVKTCLDKQSFGLTLIFYMIILLGCALNVNGQMLRVVPTSPMAAKMEKYGDYPVSLYTGVPDITIPLYEIMSGDIVVPISISYHASGFKVNDVSNPVGLGWALNAGGQISRTVRGLEDEISGTMKTYFDLSTTDFYNEMEFLHTSLSALDTQPDLFYYNFGTKGGSSGRFMFDYKSRDTAGIALKPIFLNETNVKMDAHYTGALNNISLTDDKGFLYKYGTGGSNSVEYTGNGASRWMLNEIYPANRAATDKVAFSYSNGAGSDISYIPEYALIIDSVKVNPLSPAPYTYHDFKYLGKNFETIADHSWKIEGQEEATGYNIQQKNVTEITFKGGKVVFTYNDTNEFLASINIYNANNEIIRSIAFTYGNYEDGVRKRLDQVSIKNAGSVTEQTYSFEYNAGAVHVNPYAIDKWDYYNGAENNYSYMPAQQVPLITGIFDNLSGLTFTRDAITIGNAYRGTTEAAMKQFVLKKIIYPTGGSTEFEFEANKYLDQDAVLRDIGGLRIKNIKSNDGLGHVQQKEYRYGANNSGGGELANNRGFTDPFLTYETDLFESSTGMALARRRYYSSSVNPLINFYDGSPIYYEDVEETQKDGGGIPNGKTVYKFQIPIATSVAPYSSSIATTPEKYIEVFFGHMFPSLISKSNWRYNAPTTSFTKLDEETTSYTLANNNQLHTYGYNVHKSINYLSPYTYNLGPTGTELPSEPWLRSAMDSYQEETQVIDISFFNQFKKPERTTYSTFKDDGTEATTETTNYEYGNTNFHAYPTKITKSSSNKKIAIKTYKYPLDYQGITGVATLDRSINYLKSINYVSPLIEEVNAIADETLLNKKITSATLNLFHPDKPYLSKMFSTEFAEPSLSFSESQVTAGSITTDAAYKEKLNLDYTPAGQLKEEAVAAGPKTCYIWSYNGQYPVAKIDNASYATVQTVLDSTEIESIKNRPIPTDAALNAFLAPLRTSPTLANAQITTYTYSPLVGITSSTSPKGVATYYEYDSFQRLKYVRDQHMNIVKSYCYNYAGQVANCNLPGGGGIIPLPTSNNFQAGYTTFRNNICNLAQPGDSPVQAYTIYSTATSFGAPVAVGQPQPIFYLDAALSIPVPNGYYTLYERNPSTHAYKFYYVQNGILVSSGWCDAPGPIN